MFFLSSTNGEQRMRFLQFTKNNGIKPANIFFIEIRLCPQTQKKINRGDELAMKKLFVYLIKRKMEL